MKKNVFEATLQFTEEEVIRALALIGNIPNRDDLQRLFFNRRERMVIPSHQFKEAALSMCIMCAALTVAEDGALTQCKQSKTYTSK